MMLKELRLTLASVARTSNAKGMEVASVAPIYGRDETGTTTDTVTGYSVNCSGNRGAIIKVKFPVTVKEKWEDLKNRLDTADVLITIGFKGLKITPYALTSKDGRLISGVSAKADDFEIINTQADDIDFDVIE